MFDNNVFTEGSFRNVREGGKTVGFAMQTNITYYRGIPLSMVNDIGVTVDGIPVAREAIRFSPDGQEFFTLDEMMTVTSIKWEYDTKATVLVRQAGGLAPGEHEVELSVDVRTAYIPFPLKGVMKRTVQVS